MKLYFKDYPGDNEPCIEHNGEFIPIDKIDYYQLKTFKDIQGVKIYLQSIIYPKLLMVRGIQHQSTLLKWLQDSSLKWEDNSISNG